MLVGAIYLIFGLSSTIGFCIAATIGFLTLETINYVEHYGLRRELLENGKYERVQPIILGIAIVISEEFYCLGLTRHSIITPIQIVHINSFVIMTMLPDTNWISGYGSPLPTATTLVSRYGS